MAIHLSVSASSVKSWFQYRCQRKFVYETMRRAEREAIPVLEQGMPDVWSQFGDAYEREVVEKLRREPATSVSLNPRATSASHRRPSG